MIFYFFGLKIQHGTQAILGLEILLAPPIHSYDWFSLESFRSINHRISGSSNPVGSKTFGSPSRMGWNTRPLHFYCYMRWLCGWREQYSESIERKGIGSEPVPNDPKRRLRYSYQCRFYDSTLPSFYGRSSISIFTEYILRKRGRYTDDSDGAGFNLFTFSIEIVLCIMYWAKTYKKYNSLNIHNLKQKYNY